MTLTIQDLGALGELLGSVAVLAPGLAPVLLTALFIGVALILATGWRLGV